MSGPVNLFVSTVNRLSGACGAVAACLIGASILIVCQMVMWRYVLVASTSWQTDFVTFALVGATIVGAPYVLREGGHVKVDLVTNAVAPALRRVFLVVSYLTIAAMAAIFAWKGGVLTWEAWHGSWVTDTVAELPLWVPYSALPIGFTLLGLQALADMIVSLRGGAAEPAAPGHD